MIRKIAECDLCKKEIPDYDNLTQVIIKDRNGFTFDDYGLVWKAQRKWRGIICDECLKKLRDAAGENSNEEAD